MKIGFTELIIIFIVALVVIGPDKLPYYAKKFGEALAQFRKYSDEATKEIKESIVEPLEEAQRPLKEAMEPLQELDKSLRHNVTDVQKSFSNIGKDTPEKRRAEADKAAKAAEESSNTSVLPDTAKEADTAPASAISGSSGTKTVLQDTQHDTGDDAQHDAGTVSPEASDSSQAALDQAVPVEPEPRLKEDASARLIHDDRQEASVTPVTGNIHISSEEAGAAGAT